MDNSPDLFLPMLILAGALGLVTIAAGLRLRPAGPVRPITALTVLPALAMLGLFYSLAVHMYRSLGGWPATIGDHGFPASLVTHASLTAGAFSALVLTGLVAWPLACLSCALVRRWRGAIFYLGVYAIACSICFGAMLLAPSPFLNWWWD